MTEVFKEHYEITGKDALAKARAFIARRQAAHDAHWKLVKELKAEGYRPGHSGDIRSIMFHKDKIPHLFRRIGWDQGHAECVPLLKSKAGKELAARIKAVPKIESWRVFVDEFGWNGRSPMGESSGGRLGMCIYYGTGVRVSKPKERYFLQLPRTLKDGWKMPKGLKLVRESTMLMALEDHNAAVNKVKARAAWATGTRSAWTSPGSSGRWPGWNGS